MSRGLENRNPGNIRHSSSRYRGEVRPSRDPAFKEFEAIEWGYRAIFVTQHLPQKVWSEVDSHDDFALGTPD